MPIQEIVLDPGEVKAVSWWRYWRRTGVLAQREFVNELVLTTSNVRLKFRGRKWISRLLNYLDLKYNDIKDLDPEERNIVILEALKSREKKLKIAHENGYVVRIVSEEFQPIPHRYIMQKVREILEERGLDLKEKVFKFKRGFFGGYVIGSAVEDYYSAIWIFNYNDGRHALRVYAGLWRVSCNNPFIVSMGYVIHRWNTEEAIRKAVEKAVDFIRGLNIVAKNVDKEEAWKAIRMLYRRFPQYVVDYLQEHARRLFAGYYITVPNTVVANVLTYPIPREDWPDYVKIGLLKEARKWLTRT